MKQYDVVCGKCKAVRRIGIIKGAVRDLIDWGANSPDPMKVKIISGRKRFDDQWGWQCICGNNDLWTPQEEKNVESKSNPRAEEMAQIIKSLKPVKSKFKMVEV